MERKKKEKSRQKYPAEGQSEFIIGIDSASLTHVVQLLLISGGSSQGKLMFNINKCY